MQNLIKYDCLRGSLDDHESLVTVVKQVDVVISSLAGTIVCNEIIQQIKLTNAIKEAGNIKVFRIFFPFVLDFHIYK